MKTRVSALVLGVAAAVVQEGRARADETTLIGAGGVAAPACTGIGSSCAGSLGFGPSLDIMVASREHEHVNWILGARATRQHWQATYQGQIQGAPPSTVDLDLTALFVGGGVRLTLLPDADAHPIAIALAGLAMQQQSGTTPSVWGGPLPTVVLGGGVTRRLSPRVGLFLMAVVSTGLAFSQSGGSDGPPPAPLASWGAGLNIGIEIDFPDRPRGPR
jgi:hypothetical protein